MLDVEFGLDEDGGLGGGRGPAPRVLGPEHPHPDLEGLVPGQAPIARLEVLEHRVAAGLLEAVAKRGVVPSKGGTGQAFDSPTGFGSVPEDVRGCQSADTAAGEGKTARYTGTGRQSCSTFSPDTGRSSPRSCGARG